MGFLDYFFKPANTILPPTGGDILMGSSSQIQDGETMLPVRAFDADASQIVGGNGETANVDDTQLLVSDTLNHAAVTASVALSTDAVVARVGASNLAHRKTLIVQATSNNVLWGFSAASQPFSLINTEKATFDIGPNIDLYVKVSVGVGSISVAEIS